MLIVKPRLTEIREERGLTQLQLSEMSGVPQGSISRFDSNSRHEATHLFAIARALGISVEELFTVNEAEE
ncbi:Helix-turn-helix domain protein [compost metagenome]